MSAEALASKVGERVSCICYFGGDPSPQMPHAIKTSELALERAQDRILRICWESNGYMREGLLDRASLLSFKSGGVVKFDLKAYSDELNQALCGVSNKPTLKNFERVGERFFHDRPDVPLLTASTLLVPGYVDEKEVEGLASFIASVDVNIPYTLLAFHPHYVMNDLSTTRRKHALACLKAAEQAGLRNVRLGNVWLLS
jgi:pyruvate formate lyase activating enzyme